MRIFTRRIALSGAFWRRSTPASAFTQRWGISPRLNLRLTGKRNSRNPCYNKLNRFCVQLFGVTTRVWGSKSSIVKFGSELSRGETSSKLLGPKNEIKLVVE